MFNDKIKTGQHCGKKQQHASATRLSEGEGGGSRSCHESGRNFYGLLKTRPP